MVVGRGERLVEGKVWCCLKKVRLESRESIGEDERECEGEGE